MLRLTATICIALIFFLAACGVDKDPERQPDVAAEKILRIGNTAEPKTLDPALSTLVAEAVIIQSLFQGLADMSPDGQIIPGQAESWVISSDGLIYTFRLRAGLKWSDGTPMTADDFVYALRRVLDPEVSAEFAPFYYPIENAEAVHKGKMPPERLGVIAIGPDVVEIVLTQPKPSMIELFSHPSSYPVPKHVVENAVDGNWAIPDIMLSNGPYLLRDWQPGKVIIVEKNPFFNDAENVAIGRIDFFPLEEANRALDEFVAGKLDIALTVPLDRIEWINTNLPDSLLAAPQYGTYFYVFNIDRSPFDDVRVRQALALAINPAELIVAALGDAGFPPAHSLVPPLLPSYEAPVLPPSNEGEHLQIARSLLAEAGFGPDHPLELTLNINIGEDHLALAEAVQTLWAEIYVNANLNIQTFADHDNQMVAGDFDIARTGWLSTFDSPEYFLNLLHSDAIPLNAGRYRNSEFDRLMDEALSEARPGDRAALMRQAEVLALNDAAIIPIYHYISRELVSPTVRNWVANPAGRHMVRFVDIVPAEE